MPRRFHPYDRMAGGKKRGRKSKANNKKLNAALPLRSSTKPADPDDDGQPRDFRTVINNRAGVFSAETRGEKLSPDTNPPLLLDPRSAASSSSEQDHQDVKASDQPGRAFQSVLQAQNSQAPGTNPADPSSGGDAQVVSRDIPRENSHPMISLSTTSSENGIETEDGLQDDGGYPETAFDGLDKLRALAEAVRLSPLLHFSSSILSTNLTSSLILQAKSMSNQARTHDLILRNAEKAKNILAGDHQRNSPPAIGTFHTGKNLEENTSAKTPDATANQIDHTGIMESSCSPGKSRFARNGLMVCGRDPAVSSSNPQSPLTPPTSPIPVTDSSETARDNYFRLPTFRRQNLDWEELDAFINPLTGRLPCDGRNPALSSSQTRKPAATTGISTFVDNNLGAGGKVQKEHSRNQELSSSDENRAPAMTGSATSSRNNLIGLRPKYSLKGRSNNGANPAASSSDQDVQFKFRDIDGGRLYPHSTPKIVVSGPSPENKIENKNRLLDDGQHHPSKKGKTVEIQETERVGLFSHLPTYNQYYESGQAVRLEITTSSEKNPVAVVDTFTEPSKNSAVSSFDQTRAASNSLEKKPMKFMKLTDDPPKRREDVHVILEQLKSQVAMVSAIVFASDTVCPSKHAVPESKTDSGEGKEPSPTSTSWEKTPMAGERPLDNDRSPAAYVSGRDSAEISKLKKRVTMLEKMLIIKFDDCEASNARFDQHRDIVAARFDYLETRVKYLMSMSDDFVMSHLEHLIDDVREGGFRRGTS